MTPVYKSPCGRVTLFYGDCAEVIPHLNGIDAVVTDPPYGIDYADKGLRGKGDGYGNGDKNGWRAYGGSSDWDKERPSPETMKSILGLGSVHVIWGGNYFTDILPPTMQWLIWDKGQRGFSLADCEIAWSSTAGAARVLNFARGKLDYKSRTHPTQKPVEVMTWCMLKAKVPSACLVLDPFMGSGTTGVACLHTGRRFIGIEKDLYHFTQARERLELELQEPFLIEPSGIKAEPMDLAL